MILRSNKKTKLDSLLRGIMTIESHFNTLRSFARHLISQKMFCSRTSGDYAPKIYDLASLTFASTFVAPCLEILLPKIMTPPFNYKAAGLLLGRSLLGQGRR
jgi:hypothetical protein